MKITAPNIVAIAALAGFLALGSGAALAQTLASLPAPTSPAEAAGQTRPVQGWVKLCEQAPQECAVDTSEPEVVPLTRQAWQLIVTVNAKVNATIKPLTDDDHWGVADVWSLPDDGYGDCEDYQLLKRKLLVQAGLPRRALRMTVVIDEKGQGHAVLMARTDRGDLILDNKVPSVLPWHQTGYIYVKREGQDGAAWTSLGGAMSPVTTANR
jgi:predicted transglutaminase-like cysteine proteinase